MPGKLQVHVLCLHGMGVNAEVFSMQSAGFRALMPSYYRFHFVGAEIPCDPSPGATDLYAGPYYCWYPSPSTDRVAAAHATLDRFLDAHGPFQLVMGFSQGAALAASYLLQCEIERKPSPFEAAIFFCSPLPFSKTTAYGFDSRKYFSVDTSVALQPPRPTNVPSYLIPASYFLRSMYGDEKVSEVVPDSATASLTEGFTPDRDGLRAGGPFYNMFHPTVDKVRIRLPTAHVYGARDSWRRHGTELTGLCSDAVVFEHSGGHDIPRHVSEEICDLIEGVVANAGIV